MRINKFDEAYADYSAAIRLDNKDAESYYWRAVILLQRDETRAALSDLREACELTRYKQADYVKLLDEVEEHSAKEKASPVQGPSIL